MEDTRGGMFTGERTVEYAAAGLRTWLWARQGMKHNWDSFLGHSGHRLLKPRRLLKRHTRGTVLPGMWTLVVGFEGVGRCGTPLLGDDSV